MAELKTKKNDASVEEFINTVENEKRKSDAKIILKLMQKISGCKPKMWGTSIIGYGSYHYKYDSGREGDWMITGFSPRKQNLTIYIMPGFNRYEELMKKLGKYKTGKSCLYINTLEDINMNILEELISSSIEYMKTKYPTNL